MDAETPSEPSQPVVTAEREPISPVYAGDVYDHVDHVAAQFVGLHVHRRAVGGDVDFANNIKQEGLLNPRMLKDERSGVNREGDGKEEHQSLREAVNVRR